MNLASHFIKYVKQHHLFEENSHLLVAVSGGIDSCVLLHLLLQIRHRYPVRISVGHYNHSLRGMDSDADEEFVAELAQSHSLPYFSAKGDVCQYAADKKISIEMAARECRYQFLHQTAEAISADYILTAHNADDQAETVLQHLIRGSGPRGLAGIRPKKNRIVRPLLFAPRKEIENYARAHKIHYREDASNYDTTIQRNQLRHDLIPHLEENYNKSIVEVLSRTAENFGELDDYLEDEAQKALARCIKQRDKNKIILDIFKFFTYFNFLKKYMLRAAIQEVGSDPNQLTFEIFRQIDALLAKQNPESVLSIDEHTVLCVTTSEIYIGHAFERLQPIEIKEIPGRYKLGTGWIFEIKADSKPLIQKLKEAGPSEEWIDSDLLERPIRIRPLEKGDRFLPIGFGKSKKVADFLSDQKVPIYERGRIPILTSGKNIVWIGGIRLDDRFKITNKTRNVTHIALSK